MLIRQQGTAPDGNPFNIYQLKNKQNMCVEIMDWGATWLSCQVPVSQQLREVLLGCQPEDYCQQQAYLGATIGRYANRIANAEFSLNGIKQKLSANQGKHQLHGGKGFDQRRWQLEKCGQNFLSFLLHSADGDQGFAGNLEVRLTYRLTEDNSLEIEFEAQTDQATALNLTNHAYFNLQNAQKSTDVRQHLLQLNSNYFVPVDQEGIPNAPLKPVAGTSFDFRQGKLIAQDFLQDEQKLTKGYDHSFLLNSDLDHWVATLLSPNQDLCLQVYSSQPALQVYTGNYLQGTPTRAGDNEVYADYSGIALETQCLPDTPNHPEWQVYGGITQAGESYRHWTRFQFISHH